MSSSNAKYNDEVAAWLKEIEPGWRVIDDICMPENKDRNSQANHLEEQEARYEKISVECWKRLRSEGKQSLCRSREVDKILKVLQDPETYEPPLELKGKREESIY